MAVAADPEYPGAVTLISVLLGSQNDHAGKVALVDLGIFRMHMIDAIAELANGRNRIDALPEHMARIVVAADRLAGDGAQLQHRLRRVADEARMHFDGDANS